MTINELIRRAHDNAVKHGFWDKPRETGTMLALIHSEVSEALEADRKGNKENFAEELADTIIRIGDLCGGLGINLEEAVQKKMAENEARPYKHGKKY